MLRHAHLMSWHFDVRHINYFHTVYKEAVGMDGFISNFEYAKSRGAKHAHSLTCSLRRAKALTDALGDTTSPRAQIIRLLLDELGEPSDSSKEKIAQAVSDVAEVEFGLTAMYPFSAKENAARDGLEVDTKRWPPPDGDKPKPCSRAQLSKATRAAEVAAGRLDEALRVASEAAQEADAAAAAAAAAVFKLRSASTRAQRRAKSARERAERTAGVYARLVEQGFAQEGYFDELALKRCLGGDASGPAIDTDYEEVVDRCMIHVCSAYCHRKKNAGRRSSKKRVADGKGGETSVTFCRMLFGVVPPGETQAAGLCSFCRNENE
jgi:hypothetical protein